MSGVELALAFLSGVVTGILLDRWLLPPLVDAWIYRMRRHGRYERIVVTGRTIVSIRLTPSAYAHGLALALPEKVALARPTGFGRALATYDVPIEGRDEWLAAAKRLA